jgi:hypothetical protein
MWAGWNKLSRKRLPLPLGSTQTLPKRVCQSSSNRRLADFSICGTNEFSFARGPNGNIPNSPLECCGAIIVGGMGAGADVNWVDRLDAKTERNKSQQIRNSARMSRPPIPRK